MEGECMYISGFMLLRCGQPRKVNCAFILCKVWLSNVMCKSMVCTEFISPYCKWIKWASDKNSSTCELLNHILGTKYSLWRGQPQKHSCSSRSRESHRSRTPASSMVLVQVGPKQNRITFSQCFGHVDIESLTSLDERRKSRAGVHCVPFAPFWLSSLGETSHTRNTVWAHKWNEEPVPHGLDTKTHNCLVRWADKQTHRRVWRETVGESVPHQRKAKAEKLLDRWMPQSPYGAVLAAGRGRRHQLVCELGEWSCDQ